MSTVISSHDLEKIYNLPSMSEYGDYAYYCQIASLHHATTMGGLGTTLDSLMEWEDDIPPHVYRPIWKVIRSGKQWDIVSKQWHPSVENNDPITLKSIMKIPGIGKRQAGYIKQWLEDKYGLDIPDN
jgi:hypothetical protein